LESDKKYDGHSWGITGLATHENGIFASVSLDSQLKIWNHNTGKKLKEIDCSPVETFGVAIHPNGDLISVTAHTGGVVFYDANSGTSKQTLSTGENGFTFGVAFSPNGRLMATTSWTGKKGILSLFDVESGKLLHNIEAHAMPIRSVSFSRDSKSVFTASDDRHVNIYDISAEGSPNIKATVSGHGSWVLSVACSLDFKQFATASSDRTVKIWDISTRQCLHTFDNHTDQVWGLAWNAKAELAAVSSDKSISIYTQ